jgi:hypothetical protein
VPKPNAAKVSIAIAPPPLSSLLPALALPLDVDALPLVEPLASVELPVLLPTLPEVPVVSVLDPVEPVVPAVPPVVEPEVLLGSVELGVVVEGCVFDMPVSWLVLPVVPELVSVWPLVLPLWSVVLPDVVPEVVPVCVLVSAGVPVVL